MSLTRLIQEFRLNFKKYLIPRQEAIKLKVKRERLWEDGLTIIDAFFRNRLPIEIEFEGENGVGPGPTREFFSLMAKNFAMTCHHLFREGDYISTPDDQATEDKVIYDKNGLFPAADSNLAEDYSLYHLFGVLVAKALSLEIPLGIPLNGALIKAAMGEKITIKDVDPDLGRVLSKEYREGLIGDVYFTYPKLGFDLIENGFETEVTSENIDQFVEKIEEYTISTPACQAFGAGFSSVMPIERLSLFTESEVGGILSGETYTITENIFLNAVDTSLGYNRDSPQFLMLAKIVSEFNPEEQMKFVQFMTGSSLLPSGGLPALVPRMTVVQKDPSNQTNDPNSELPTASVCSYLLKLPAYTTQEIMKEKLLLAINEGSQVFGLT